jgi:hypothetical protein
VTVSKLEASRNVVKTRDWKRALYFKNIYDALPRKTVTTCI